MKKKNETITRKENYNFRYQFTKEELEEKAKQLAKSCEERTSIEDEKKSVMSDFKAKIDSKTAEINHLSNNINSGYEYVTKTCEVEYDFEAGFKKYFYDGVQVGKEKMTSNDYQLEAEI